MMDLIILLLVIAVIGFLVYLIITYIPMPDIFKTAITILAVVFIIIFLIRSLGVAIPNVMH